MMKKLFACIAVLSLLMAVTVQPAAADSLISTAAHDWKYAQMVESTGNIVVSDSSGYYLVDRNGNVLSDVYQDLTVRGDVCRVTQNGKDGMIDAGTGQILVPCEYDHTEYLDSENTNWLVGYRLMPTGTEDYNDFYSTNYNTNTKTYYIIDSTDFYYNGTKVGTLARSEYTNNYYCSVRGSYLLMRSSNGTDNTKVFSPDFSVRVLSERTSSEYDYNNVHCGTGQVAFAPGCTLTKEEVETSVFEKNNFFYDLQGNLLFAAQQPYDSCSIINNDYVKVRMDKKYGIIDMQGNTVIPCVCDEISAYDTAFPGGYQAVSQDGKIAFYNTRGELTCPPVYAYSAASVRGPFATLKDLMGGVVVLSGAIGELPEHYADVQINYGTAARCFVAQNADGEIGVVDLFGNELVPFSSSIRYMYDVEVSADGTVILARNADRQYIVYQIAVSDDTAAAAAPDVPVAPAEENDASWTCPSCGLEGVASNFCPNCGTARPEAPKAQSCPNCGYVVPEGNTVNFCPNCGTKIN